MEKKFKALSRNSIFDQVIKEKRLEYLGYRYFKIDLKVDISEPHQQ